MKKLILLFVFISVLIAMVISLNSKPTLVENSIQTASSVTAPSGAEVQKNSGKVLSVMPQEYKKEEHDPDNTSNER